MLTNIQQEFYYAIEEATKLTIIFLNTSAFTYSPESTNFIFTRLNYKVSNYI